MPRPVHAGKGRTPMFKSDVEAPWDSFTRHMEPVLARVSRPLRQQHRRWLSMGGATRLSGPDQDVFRFPVELRGGDREYAVATVFVLEPRKKFYDASRMEAIALAALEQAEQHLSAPPPTPGALELRYP